MVLFYILLLVHMKAVRRLLKLDMRITVQSNTGIYIVLYGLHKFPVGLLDLSTSPQGIRQSWNTCGGSK